MPYGVSRCEFVNIEVSPSSLSSRYALQFGLASSNCVFLEGFECKLYYMVLTSGPGKEMVKNIDVSKRSKSVSFKNSNFCKLDEGRSVPFCEGIPLVHVEGTLGRCFLMSVQREPDSTRSAS